MKYLSLIAFTLNFAIIFSSCRAEVQVVAQDGIEQSQVNLTQQESEGQVEQKVTTIDLDPIIVQAIKFSNAIGDWFDNLFDKKQNMSFNTHVNSLEKIVKAMQMAIVNPLATGKDNDAIALAAYNLTSILYARAAKTYAVLDAHRDSTSTIKIGNALKKIDKTFRSEQESTKLEKAFKELNAQLVKSDSDLCKKITQLQAAVEENSTRTKQKGWWTLAWGLRHRLQCT